jgi:methylglutaconyl-CoA hydratase
MENFLTVKPEYTGLVVTLWLARPDVHNALNDIMIREIIAFFKAIEENDDVRIVIIRGEGKSFCSGADLQWMKNAFTLSGEENLKESEELSGMFGIIFNSSKIVIGAVHGNIFGGGNGLVAVCDLAYCMTNSRFSLSETRIGMAAASITPYLLHKVKGSDLKELIFSAKVFDGDDAVKYGLINQSFSTLEMLDQHLKNTIDQMLSNGRLALVASKRLINRLTGIAMAEEIKHIPALLAQIRVSPEAQEGFSAFLERRKPQW